MAKNRARGGGSIRQRSDGRWEARYTAGNDPLTGKQLQRSVYGKTQREAQQKLNKVLAEVDSGTYLKHSKETLASWMESWLETFAARSVKPYTLDAYQRICQVHIIPALGHIALASLTTMQVQSFYNSLTDSKCLSAKTVKNVHGVLHKALTKAVLLRKISFNPAEGCDLPRVKRKEIQPLTQEQIGDFLRAICGHVYEFLFFFTLFTGVREGEALGLTWNRIDFQNNKILIDRQLQKNEKVGGEYILSSPKNSRPRTITVSPSVMAVLRKQRSHQLRQQLAAGPAWDNPLNLVFTNAFGGHLCHTTVYKNFKVIATQIGAPDRRFHDLRHTYAVLALEAGDDIKTLQEHLGHATAAFTLSVYGHVSELMHQRSAARMDQVVQSFTKEAV